MRKQILFVLFTITYCTAVAQYTTNPLAEKKWVNVAAGLSNMDNISWNVGATASFRGDVIIMSARLAYSQELIEAANDSVFSPKNRLLELGMMWGEGYGGKNWYVSAVGGMGLNVRFFGDDEEDSDAVRRLAAVTIGVPLQIEFGIFMTDNIALTFNGIANWNFREPYAGGQMGVTYRVKKK